TPVFVGDGPTSEVLRTWYPEAELIGWQAPARVKDLMRSARVLIFPSLWYETHGLVPLESMSLGTPSIVSDGCAASAAIQDGVNGLLFRNNDIASLAEAINKFKDDDFVRRMSFAAYRAFWRDPPTLDRHVDALSNVYNRMIARSLS